MKKFLLLFAALSLALSAETPRLLIFAGSASKPPTQEAARVFTEKTGIPVDLVFGGSGYVLSQMKLTRKGDLYFPGSSDYMEIAKRQHLVDPKSEKIIVYLVPAITVAKGNPKQIRSLEDLTRPGIKVAIANPDGVCLGTYAVEILEKNFTPEQKKAFRKNLINYTASCAKTATAVSLHQVDAVIGWRVFGHWDPRRIETVPIKASRLVRIGYIPIAVSRFSRHPELAKRFIDFLLSPEGRKIFAKYHYFPSAHAAEKWIGAKKPVCGEYKVPKEWIAQ